MKCAREVMEILEAYDLTRCAHSAALLVGCDEKTVTRYVAVRDAGRDVGEWERRSRMIDPFLSKIEELVDASQGRIRADVVHEKLTAMGFSGTDRTTRRAVAEAKTAYRDGHRRKYRPWIPEPGMWLQFDWGEGPRVGGRRTQLFCAWLSWSRFRVVVPAWDQQLLTLIACLDTTLRRIGGAPTYLLTDNPRTVTIDRIAGLAVRHPDVVSAARHYGCSVRTCEPFDPESKGGAEHTVKIAKADLVPCEANLLPEYDSFAELESACTAFCDQVNNRVHRVTRRVPAEMLAEERARLHPLPEHPWTAAFGVTRTVPSNTAMIAFEYGSYSVPHTLAGQTVWVRPYADQVVIVHVGAAGPVEVARHARTTAGHPRVDDAHFPPRPEGPLHRTPRPKTVAEAQFLALGDGAALWLTEAGAAGCSRIRAKMAEAVDLAALHDPAAVDRALGQAATAGRFGHGDLAAIVAHQAGDPDHPAGQPARAGEHNSLAQGTAGWAGLGEQEDN